MARGLLWASLALTPVVIVAKYAFGVGGTVEFLLACGALCPLAYMIGKATENVAEHTGPGIGGFVNASFGNAPELIIALLAVHQGLPDVVRGSITGSIVSNLLLVTGFAIIAAGRGPLDRRSLGTQIATIVGCVALFLVPSIPGWHGSPDRHTLYLVSLPVAAVLLGFYIVVTWRNLRRHRDAHVAEAHPGAWSLPTALWVLAAATVATAFVSEALVGALTEFGQALGLSDFFVAVVIVAIVGNAAEHGGAIVVARKGNLPLASEIAISSSTQVALFVAPAIALCSWLVGRGLPLAFRPVEIATMAGAALFVGLGVTDGRARRWEGFALLALYGAAVAAYALSGDA